MVSAGQSTANRPSRPTAHYRLYSAPGSPLDREHIAQPIATGIRAIDTITPVGKGQRMGIFGGSGVGKSTLLGAMSRHNSADVTVIALIGERNREVRAFLEQELGPEGSSRSVVVCATSDRPAPLRVRACFVALAVAEYFRDQGANVLFIMDSVTRLAMAQREIGLAAGEPPSQKGYTPSVFNLLPRILERAGNFQKGSITGFFTVLVEGDDFNEPICDAVRAILDGHIILSRRLAATGHYPAIDVMHSISRLTSQLSTPAQLAAARKIREALSIYEDSRDLIELGAYTPGAIRAWTWPCACSPKSRHSSARTHPRTPRSRRASRRRRPLPRDCNRAMRTFRFRLEKSARMVHPPVRRGGAPLTVCLAALADARKGHRRARGRAPVHRTRRALSHSHSGAPISWRWAFTAWALESGDWN
jgi:FliI/YscN family ATPase